MDPTLQADEQLEALASYLHAHREDILLEWRTAVKSDPELASASSIPRIQLNDNIPDILDALEQTLQVWPHRESDSAQEERKHDSAGHGLQRWQQGYQLREVTREWGHLQMCLASQLEAFALANPDLEPRVMPTAWRALASMCCEGVCESATQYFQLQQTEAAAHLRDLEEALKQVQELERRRTELWRQAVHDLRGNFGVVKNATQGLALDGIPESAREECLQLLQQSVSSLHSMLDGVMNLARLQAGHESREIVQLDAADLLRQLCDNLGTLAEARGLSFRADGPERLLVDGDPVKIKRIVQNLILNAIKYIREGQIVVTWGDSRSNDPERWMLCIEDTGPGFETRADAPLADALTEATSEAHQAETKTGSAGLARMDTPSPIHPKPESTRKITHLLGRSEGIGLSIVKRLCEMLDATMELESQPGKGTKFRIVFPRKYSGLAAV